MIRTAILAAATAAMGVSVSAQIGCLPPEEPFAYEPPADDPELRALIDEQYQDYILSTESYLNCLNAETVRARAVFETVMERYLRYFGDEAGVELRAPG